VLPCLFAVVGEEVVIKDGRGNVKREEEEGRLRKGR